MCAMHPFVQTMEAEDNICTATKNNGKSNEAKIKGICVAHKTESEGKRWPNGTDEAWYLKGSHEDASHEGWEVHS